MKRTMPLYRGWVTWNTTSGDYIWPGNTKYPEAGTFDKGQLRDMEWYFGDYQDAPIAYFLPHGRPWSANPETVANGMHTFPPSDYPKKFRNDGTAFINDYENDICLMMGPNQQGKSFVMTAWTAFRILQCDPEWHCFQHHNIICPEWDGTREWVLASYSWDNVTTLWQRLKMLFPKKELGKWVERDMSFLGGGTKILTCEKSKSTIRFLSYTQAQAHYEGFSCSGGSMDEQTERAKLKGILRGMTTGQGKKQIGMALTGHVMVDRPDTGAVGWIKRDIYDPKINGEENDFGLSVGLYFLSVDSTPDAIVTPETKRQLYRTWADPTVERTEQDTNEGVARFHGGWQQGGGNMIPEWRRNVHVIPPLWDDGEVPLEAELYRSMDHGESSPTTCVWIASFGAKNKWCDYSFSVMYRLYYERNVRPAISAPAIIELSGNERRLVKTERDEVEGATIDYHEEVFKKENYIFSILDSRSWSYKGGGTLIGPLYQRHGLQVGQAHGGKIHSTPQVKGNLEILRDHLRIDKSKKHIITGEYGAPRLYVFDLPCTRPFISEVEGWAASPEDKNKPMPRQDEHSIKALIYWSVYAQPPGDPAPRDDDSRSYQDENDDRFNQIPEVLTR